jgi:uncharacterized protein YjbI with pentapeptide repeats
VKERILAIWKLVVQPERGRQRLAHGRRLIVLVLVGCLLLGWGLLYGPQVWSTYRSDPNIFIPFFTPSVALLVGLAAFGQWRTARLRHEEQTNADRQRRITESFSRAVEQLGDDKLEVRLGGIYSLERISKESPDDYWMVMENLTAFVRERSRRNEANSRPNEAKQTPWDFERRQLRQRARLLFGPSGPPYVFEHRVRQRAYSLWQKAGRPDGRAEDFWAQAIEREVAGEPSPPADIAAVLAVIMRRREHSREREGTQQYRLDLSGAVLGQAFLDGAHLQKADLSFAHFEGASLDDAHFEGANLSFAHLEGASLKAAHLVDEANLFHARLDGASFIGADLKKAELNFAHLEGASLDDTHLEGAFLRYAHLEGASLRRARLDGTNFIGADLKKADLSFAYLEGATLIDAHVEGANFRDAEGLSEVQLASAYGDAATQLPAGLARPAHWLGADPPPPDPAAACPQRSLR